MSNEQNKEKVDFNNLKQLQAAVKNGTMVSLILNARKARASVDKLILSLKEKSAELLRIEREAAVAAEEKVNRSKIQEKSSEGEKVVSSSVKTTVQGEKLSDTRQRPLGSKQDVTQQKTKIRNFDNASYNRQPNSFGNAQNRMQRPNQQGQRPGSGRPFGQNGQKPGSNRPLQPRLAPVDTMSASELAKNGANAHYKKKVFAKDKPDETKKLMNKKALVMRGYVEDESVYDEDRMVAHKKAKKSKEVSQTVVASKVDHAVITTDNLTVKLLAEKIGRPVTEIIGKFLMLGIIVNINSNIDYEAAELVASELGVTLEKKVEATYEEKVAQMYDMEKDDEKDLVKRPPVVTVMGHVDHGKTSLLDRIRKTNVTQGEAGGITQHIGAYTIVVNGENVTFIDTPGHAAFTAMRERGAKLTDVAILVVAADDGVMPQTVEAINHIKAAKVPMIVAINKIDVVNANPDKIKQQLTEHDVVPEEWGGDAIIVPISAKTGENIDKLLEMVLFVAEYQNLRANPKRSASGSIIEARLDKGMGSVATVLVQNGTLSVGDNIIVGKCSGKVRAMINDKGVHVKKAGPSTPVAILGLTGVPNAGDELYVVDSELARQVAAERLENERKSMIKSADLSIDSLMNKIADSNFKDCNIIIKADVQGSLEALKSSLGVIQNDEVKVRIVHFGVGAINENDVMMAEASGAVIIGFNVKPDFKAKIIAEKSKIDIKFFKVIYEAIEFTQNRIDAMKTPKYKEVVTGHAEIRMVFKASKVGQIAGTYVLDGKISKNSKVRVFRKDKLLFEGNIATIQREKNEAKEVNAGYECGVVFDGFADFVVGDTFETYNLERIN